MHLLMPAGVHADIHRCTYTSIPAHYPLNFCVKGILNKWEICICTFTTSKHFSQKSFYCKNYSHTVSVIRLSYINFPTHKNLIPKTVVSKYEQHSLKGDCSLYVQAKCVGTDKQNFSKAKPLALKSESFSIHKNVLEHKSQHIYMCYRYFIIST